MKSNFQREKLLILSNIASMTVTFLVLGAFITIVALTQTAIYNLEKQAQVTIFFKDEFPQENILKLQQEIQSDERVSAVRYVSKEDAFALFTELNRNDPILLESISANILPASLEIKTRDLDNLPQLAEQFSSIDGVEEVKYFKDVIERFKQWSNIAYTVGFILVALFFVISLSIIMITIRLTINSKGRELEILKLVGAADDYVKKPLIRQSIIFGVASALIASSILLIVAVILQVTGAFSGHIELSILPDLALNITVFTILLSFALIAIGFSLSYIGSTTAIRRYLKY